jgi:hypothetical protein
MRAGTASSLLLLSACVLASSAVKAQVSIHGTGEASIGYNDNILNAPTRQIAGRPTKEGMAFSTLRPGVLLYYDRGQAIHRLGYNFTANLFLARPAANSYANQAHWTSFLTLSRKVELSLGAMATYGWQNTSFLLQPSASVPISPAAIGQVIYFSPTVDEAVTWAVSKRWEFRQTGHANYFYPVESPSAAPQGQRLVTNLGAGLDRIWRDDAVGGLLNVIYYRANEVILPSTQQVYVPKQEQIVLSAGSRWRRDISEHWSSMVMGGLAHTSKTDFSGGVFTPIFTASLNYFDDVNSGSITFTRLVQPNIFVARTLQSEQLALQGQRRLFGPDSSWTLSSTAGFQRNTILLGNEQEQQFHAFVFLSDTTLRWHPVENFSFGLRYLHFQQVVNNEEASSAIFGLTRNVAMITVTGMFPYRRPPTVPTGPPVRVDGADRGNNGVTSRTSDTNAGEQPSATQRNTPNNGSAANPSSGSAAAQP